MRFATTIVAGAVAMVALAGLAMAQTPQASAPDAAQMARGDALFNSLACSSCHGPLGLGGPNNAADLTKSAIAQAPDGGRTLHAFLQVGRPELGMPPAQLTLAQATDLSAKLRSLAPPPAPPRTAAAGPALPAALAGQDLSIVVGDPKIGRAYFNSPQGRCSTCHAIEAGRASPAANLAHIATKFKAEKELQQQWLLPGRDVAWSPRKDNTVTAVATYADGHEVRGYLTSVSDFKLVVRDDAGKTTVIPRQDDEPKVRLVDRLQAHLDLMDVYQDSDIHNVTAYLASLK